MERTTHVQYLVSFMLDVMLLAGAPLAAATVIGLVISIFQAVTQIQDQTLGQTAKIAVICITMLLFGSYLVTPLMSNAANLFDTFGTIGQ
jgi:type III secretory pathway component EscS